jgi:palmitoyltransferase ZDHHC2/15/20
MTEKNGRNQKPSSVLSIAVFVLICFVIFAFLFMRTQDIRGQKYIISAGSVVAFMMLATTVLYTFFLTIFTHPGEVPNYWAFSPMRPLSELEKKTVGFCVETKHNGSKRNCRKCLIWKPDRTHHCRELGTCVLRLDHYCMFVNNSIGYSNHKYFLLFLFYAVAATAFVAGNVGNVLFGGQDRFLPTQWLVGYLLLFTFNAAFFLALFCFLGFHLYMTMFGYTTLEYKEKREHYFMGKMYNNPYHCSVFTNFSQILGNNVFTWLIPVKFDVEFDGSGESFPVNRLHPQIALEESFNATYATEGSKRTFTPLSRANRAVATTTLIQ